MIPLRSPQFTLLVLLVPMLLFLPSAATAATWSGSSLVNPSGVSSAALQGVSCYSSTVCNAPGQAFYTASGHWGAFAETWNGSSWTSASGVTPNPGEKNGVLYGASCPLETMCMTVGSYGTSGGFPAPMAQRQVASTWTLWKIAVPPGATRAELNDVSCSASTWCLGVGYKRVSSVEIKAFATAFDGTSWSDRGAPEKINATLEDVSCVSSSYCVAVGSFSQALGLASQPLAEIWNGSTWSVQAPPIPGSWETAVLNSAYCLSTTWCMASGSLKRNEAGTSYWRPFADIWDGSSWSTTTGVPWGGNLEGLAYGISCRSISECWIVGEGRSGSTLRPWGVKWTGSTWEIQSIGLVPNAEGAQLRDISCYGSSECKATGWSLFGGTKEPLVETVTP